MLQISKINLEIPRFWMRCCLVIAAASFFGFLLTLTTLLNLDASIPLIRAARTIPFTDKVAHIFMYGILALLVNASLGYAHFESSWLKVHTPFLQVGSLAVLVFSLTEEWIQQFFPSRTCDIGDAACNLFGIASFTWIALSINLSGRGTWATVDIFKNRTTIFGSKN